MKKIFKFQFILILLFVFPIVYSYPILIHNTNTNITLNKQVVYSINEKYFEYVKVIEFFGKPIIKRNITGNGWAWVSWDYKHRCFNGHIQLYNPYSIYHELGHIYEWCELKRNITTQEFANNFLKKWSG